MAAATVAPIKTTYEKFEPFCKWQKEEGMDTLEVHLKGFRKERLRVELNNRGVMRINGERPVNETKLIGFQKEITVPKDVKANEIRAKFSSDILYITMPKQIPQAPLQPQQITLPPKPQENEKKKPEISPEVVPKKTEDTELDGKYITMPKQTPQSPLQTQQITLPPKPQENEQKKPEMGPEAVPKKTENAELDGKYITIPKQTAEAPLQPQQITLSPKPQENEQKKPEMGPEVVPKKTENTELDGKENGLIKKTDEDDNESKGIEIVLKIQINRSMVVCVTGTFALLVGIGVFLMYFNPSKFKI